MAANEQKNHRREKPGVKGDIEILGVDRSFGAVNRGLLVAGILLGIIGLFLAPVTMRTLCILINSGGYVQDTFEIELYREATSDSYESIEGRILSSGERFTDQRTNLVGIEHIGQLAAAGRLKGYHLPVWYLPRRGVWAGLDRVIGFRMLSPGEFERPLAISVGFILFNIAFAIGGMYLVRRELRRAWKEMKSREPQ
jgi:hypothetical protein